jgi:SAM-dependent methyltransferase
MAIVVEYVRHEHEGVAFADIGCGIGNILLAIAPFCDELYGWESNPDLVQYRQALMDATAVQMQAMCVQSHVIRGPYTLTSDDSFTHVTETYPGVFWMNDHVFDPGLVRMLIDKLKHVREGSLLLHFQYVDDYDLEFFPDITTWMPSKTYARAVGTNYGVSTSRLHALKDHVVERLAQIRRC